ncbi:MAG: hypothetical protein COB76_04760 [Alphaproteobacteria bacterium]|nr:MAG: hypothetical protein COB76_04760 [Alphaproteobacteria bacterium]
MKLCCNFLMGARSEKGGALIYILIAIALLAALTSTFMNSGGQGARTQNAFKLAAELNSQARVVRSAIQDCILRYPQGHDAIAESNYNDPYPLNPDSSDAAYSAFDVTNRTVEELRCPGAAYGKLFGGTLSTFLPPQPNLMEPWTYFNGEETALGETFDGVYFQIQSTKSDPFIGESMQKMNGLFSPCEVDYTVGDNTNGCATGAQCLRVWVIRGANTTLACS